MITYDAAKPLISLHIRKCAGQSFHPVLARWFGERFFLHYFQERQALPPRHPLLPGICIHGHFNQTRGFGVPDYYPEVYQFIAVLRDPLDAAISNYFYWKTRARDIQLKNGIIEAGSAHDYRDIDDFFHKRPLSNLLDFMPRVMTPDNYQEIIETKFIWIGLTEDLEVHVDELAALLGFPPARVERLNAAPRDEALSSAVRDNFVNHNRLAFEIYRYVKERRRQRNRAVC